jgi:flagella basal body P-ring formation protein FlgA
MKRLFGALLLGGALSIAASPANAEVVTMLVPSRNIAANEAISPADFVSRQFEVSPQQKRRYIMEAAQVFGKEAARKLWAGKPVLASAVQRKASVRKGQAVPALYSDGGIEISSVLIVEEDGGPGEIIKVKNGATGIVLTARVEQDGTLRVESN